MKGKCLIGFVHISVCLVMVLQASLKLGLDKAVLQSTTSLRENSSGLSKKDVEELLKKVIVVLT